MFENVEGYGGVAVGVEEDFLVVGDFADAAAGVLVGKKWAGEGRDDMGG